MAGRKKKPEFWYAIQYDGANAVEMVTFCPDLRYDEVSGELWFNDLVVVEPTSWMLQDIAGLFSVMTDAQFVAFFQLDTGGPV
jgi:hypothetical protein